MKHTFLLILIASSALAQQAGRRGGFNQPLPFGGPSYPQPYFPQPSAVVRQPANGSYVKMLKEWEDSRRKKTVEEFQTRLNWVNTLDREREKWFEEESTYAKKLENESQRQAALGLLETENAKRINSHRHLAGIFVDQFNQLIWRDLETRASKLSERNKGYESALPASLTFPDNGKGLIEKDIARGNRDYQSILYLFQEIKEESFDATKFKDREIVLEFMNGSSPLRTDKKRLQEMEDSLIAELKAGKPTKWRADSQGTLWYDGISLGVRIWYPSEDKKSWILADSKTEQEFRAALAEAAKELFWRRPSLIKSRNELRAKLEAAVQKEQKGNGKTLPPVVFETAPRPRELATTAVIRVTDSFGRDILDRGLDLIDWDGYIANPAIEISIVRESPGSTPMNCLMKSSVARMYFDEPSIIGPEGPKKRLTLLEEGKSETAWVALWPDRDGTSEKLEIQFECEVGSGTETYKMPVHVWDYDSAGEGAQVMVERADPFPFIFEPRRQPLLTAPLPFLPKEFTIEEKATFSIVLDFSHDFSGFFNDEKNRRMVRLAADDWVHYIKSSSQKPVAPQEEVTALGREDLDTGEWKQKNQYGFKDLLIYAMGTEGLAEEYAVGKANDSNPRIVQNGMMRSGQLILGRIRHPGYEVTVTDDEWWKFDYSDNQPIDLYSMALHELGHPIGFNNPYTRVAKWKKEGVIRESFLEYYAGASPGIDRTSHLGRLSEEARGKEISEIDPASRLPGFGGVGGLMPHRRWILTKLDLMVLQAIGYTMKHVGPMVQFAWKKWEIEPAIFNRPYKAKLSVQGGIPPFNYRLVGGRLPAGVSLDSFGGNIVGTPTESGLFPLLVEVSCQRNAGELPLVQALTFLVNEN